MKSSAFDDKAFIEDESRWPGVWCALKRRPRSEGKTPFRFGIIQGIDKLTVHDWDGKIEPITYPDLDALLKLWVVD